VQKPLGEFDKTHSWGLEAGYAYSSHAFEVLERKAPKTFSSFYEAGLLVFDGRDEKILSSDTYHYPVYIHARVMTGLMMHLDRVSDISFAAGGGIGRYHGTTRFNFASKLSGSYYFKKQWGLSPVINFILEPGAAIMVTAALGCYYTF
jgi:hypothetical protein